jgi:hypothetical protein
MLTTTHLAVALFVGMLMRLNRDEWFIAIMFGVIVDADHLFALPRYIEANGWGAILRQTWDDGSGLPWRSWFHHPMSAIVVGHLSEGWRFLLPLPFWAIHLGMDWLQLAASEYNTVIESSILLVSIGGILYVGYSDWVSLSEQSGVRRYANHLLASSRVFVMRTLSFMPRRARRT